MTKKIKALVQDEGHYWSNAGVRASITIAYHPVRLTDPHRLKKETSVP